MKFKVLLLSSLLTLGTVSAVADEPKVDDSKPTTGETLEQADAITEQATQPVKEKYWKCVLFLKKTSNFEYFNMIFYINYWRLGVI